MSTPQPEPATPAYAESYTETEPTLGSVQPLQANKGDQFASFDVSAFEVPTSRDELWRFTPLRRLAGLHDGTAGAAGKATGSVQVAVAAEDPVTVETVGREDPRLGIAGVPSDRVAAQAYSGFTEATIVTVPKHATVGQTGDRDNVTPVAITLDGPGRGNVAYHHLQLHVENHAEVTFVIDQRGAGVVAENLEFIIDDGAQVKIIVLQDWEDDAVHVAQHHALLGRDAVLRHYNITLGGAVVRISNHSRFRDQGGDAELLGLYFADAGQHLEQRLLVDHSEPNCRSNVLYKGALQGDPVARKEARTVWIGDVLIRAAAEGTDTYEVNRNLLLTDYARADSVPNLEIETGEIIGAGHASATGRFEDEQLFYLRSRGIPEDQARRLVVRGFFGEIIQRIPVKDLRERLSAAVERELEISGV